VCGILGQINFVSQAFNREEFQKALNLQQHRGPDDSGIYEAGNFIFGHRRLSIIDLSSEAKQPMVSKCGNYILSFNGEIYNYKEVKLSLLQRGYTFYTSSDTEVLLVAYMEYGIECIEKFIGMFAFCIFDKQKDKFFIVRDRLGIKPLYFYKNREKIIFSSEIKSILALGIKRELNSDALSSYLSFRYPILEDTFFHEIYSLAPGHYMEITKGNIETVKYWELRDKFQEQQNDKGEEFYKQKLVELLESSVKYRMISDVKFGAFLSGGVDSSVITAIMAKTSNEPVKTFTIGFEEDGYNEFSYAKTVSELFNTDHKEIILSGKNYVQTMQKLIEFKDAPLSVPNEVPLYLMSKELKKYISVVLSGEGADEIFAGYGRIFRSPYDYERIKNIDTLNLTHNEKEILCKNFIKKYGVKSFTSELEHFMALYEYTSFNDKRSLLHSSLDIESIEEKLTNKFLFYFNELQDESYHNKLMYVFEKIHLVGLLHRVDTTTMAASVEARVPFVDHRLVEFAFTIPIKYKLKWINENSQKSSKLLMSDEISEKYDVPKYILKSSFEKILPKDILYREKMGFPVPLRNWFGGTFNDYAKEILLSERAKKRNIYNSVNIEKILNSDNLSDHHHIAMQIWMLINLEIFIEKYFD
jgi:asparagine synthase (glutamine-hydrolysing)